MPEPKRSAIRIWRGIATAAGVIFVLLAVAAARRETPTIDEFAHLPAGCAYWTQGAFALYSKNPPLGRLWIALPVVADPRVTVPTFSKNPLGWGPWEYGQRFMQANRALFFTLFFRARAMVLVLGLATGILVFAWTRRLFGERGAGVAAASFFLSPTILAHSHLATVDVASMLTVFLACWSLVWARRRGGALAMAIAGTALGVALAVKFTGLLIVPAAAVLLAVGGRGAEERTGTRGRLGLLARDVAIVATAALLVVHASYGFQGSFRRLDSYPLRSSFCSGVQRMLPVPLPVPLPRDFVTGFDAQKRDTESGEFETYLNGKWSKSGWWYYNLVALGVKTPIPVLLLALAGVILWRKSGLRPADSWPILLPSVSLLLFLSLMNRLDTGVRYLLPLYPFLHLAAGAAFADRLGAGRRRWRDALAAVAVTACLATALLARTDSLAYFNWIAGGEASGHKWLVDSNLDWGQDLYRIPGEVRRFHPEGPIGLLYFGHVDPALYGIEFYSVPSRPVEGVLAVSVGFVMGQQYLAPAPDGKLVWVGQNHLAWLRSHEPVARAGSMWIYDTRKSSDGARRSP